MDNLLSVILLGVLEGITEFLPVSSTGHLLIGEHLGLGHRGELFNIGVQAGAILAVTVIYWQRLIELARGLRGSDTTGNRSYLLKLTTAFAITAALGLLVKKLGFELPDTVTPIAWALIIGGFWIFVAEHFAQRSQPSSHITWLVAVVVGVSQIVAGVFPGTSRSAATIFAAMLCGTSDRKAATEFSFLVGIPTMYAASGYALLKELKSGVSAQALIDLGVGFVVAAITAFVVVKWLLRYVQTHTFNVFAYYRIALGAALLWFMPSS